METATLVERHVPDVSVPETEFMQTLLGVRREMFRHAKSQAMHPRARDNHQLRGGRKADREARLMHGLSVSVSLSPV